MKEKKPIPAEFSNHLEVVRYKMMRDCARAYLFGEYEASNNLARYCGITEIGSDAHANLILKQTTDWLIERGEV